MTTITIQTDDNEVKNFFLSFAEFIKQNQDKPKNNIKELFGCMSDKIKISDNFNELETGF
ncbi:MAG: DUF2281 domain-containing protein [Oscillospiraceae bacterium]|nr:DUF2281 domain-containing protein [Oscillospiraceae bacterium]